MVVEFAHLVPLDHAQLEKSQLGSDLVECGISQYLLEIICLWDVTVRVK